MSDPVNMWLGAQREAIERWLATSAPDGSQDSAQYFWKSIAPGLSPQAQELAQQLAQLGPVFAAGANDALFELFGGATPKAAAKAEESAASPFARWLDLAPVGYFREHQAQIQELVRALNEYQSAASQMTSAVVRIHGDALERLAKKTQELAQAGAAITDTRRLYDLWIECGEQAFAEQARGETFGLVQGALVNAAVRVRIAQQTAAEYFLKSLDLPTRAELNSVHKRLKELRDRIEQLERAPATAKRAVRSKR